MLRCEYLRFFLLCRPEYLERTLHSLANLTGLSHISVYISQDGDDEKVTEVVDRFGETDLKSPRTRVFDHWHRSRQPLLSPKQVGPCWLHMRRTPHLLSISHATLLQVPDHFLCHMRHSCKFRYCECHMHVFFNNTYYTVINIATFTSRYYLLV